MAAAAAVPHAMTRTGKKRLSYPRTKASAVESEEEESDRDSKYFFLSWLMTPASSILKK